MTIKLNWNKDLGIDLDSHLSFDSARIYFAKRKDQGAFLNIDTDKGDPGETIYLEFLNANDIYRFYVDNYTGGDLNPGVAQVNLLNANGQTVGTFDSPFWSKNLRWWHVFDLSVDSNGSTTLTTVNKME